MSNNRRIIKFAIVAHEKWLTLRKPHPSDDKILTRATT